MNHGTGKQAPKGAAATVTSANHEHHTTMARRAKFTAPSKTSPHLAPAQTDDAVLDQLFYATLDECPQCRAALLDRVASDARATHKLVDWACLIASEMYCGLPAELTEEDAAGDTRLRPSATFRRLAMKYRMQQRTTSAMYHTRQPPQCREAADTAVTLVAGLDRYWTDFLYL
jgi:hypothetical protein